MWFKKRKKKYCAWDFLPYHSRSVVVESYGRPPFSAHLTSKDGYICWHGTCGSMKDKHIIVTSGDYWYYE